MNVLIIDDDGDDTALFCEALKDVAPHSNCIIAPNCKAGLTYLLTENIEVPSYIFLDANMPVMGGAECLMALRKMESLKGTKIIIYSGTASDQKIEEFKRLGANEYFIKPNAYGALRELLSSLLTKQL